MKRFLALTVITAVMFLGSGFAGAETIQFPYVNSNPGNLSTIISVVNYESASWMCDTGDTLRLHYTYVTKSVTAAHTDACEELDFDRPTTPYDIVTFDLAGNLNGGLAMFNDGTSYAAGVGNPNFDLPTLGTSEPRRGYVLVNHRCVNGGDRPTSAIGGLDGEAMLFDVVNGAAWNYAAMQSVGAYLGDYGFASYLRQQYNDGPVGTIPFGISTDLALENVFHLVDTIPIMPPSQMNTRFLVTPQFIASNVITTNDMSNVSSPGQKRTRIQLIGRSAAAGMNNRNEDMVSGGGPVHVRCVAGVDLSELLGLAATTIQDEGGFALMRLLDPTPLSGVDTSIDGEHDHAAFIFKLEFGAPDWASGQMINTARSIRTLKFIVDFFDFESPG